MLTYCFDFDLYLDATSDYKAELKLGNNIHTDVYVLEWGKGRIAPSFTDMIKGAYKYNHRLSRFHAAWTDYIKYGGTTINFLKYNSDDADIRTSKWWKML